MVSLGYPLSYSCFVEVVKVLGEDMISGADDWLPN